MRNLDTLRERLQYNGGNAQQARMNKGKLQTLKKALLYSYQAATAILADGREFRCLINSDKLKTDYDDKIISIPFEDICLNRKELNKKNNKPYEMKKTTEGIEEIGMKSGDVFTWKENNTDWIVYLRRYEETAYFRAEIRRCKYEVTIGDKTYKVYAKGPGLTEIDWRLKADTVWNDIDYTVTMYITKDENTLTELHRFTQLKLNERNWEVQTVDSMSEEGIIMVYLKEYYENSIQEAVKEESEQKKPEPITYEIQGDVIVSPYDIKEYYINDTNGKWEIDNIKKAQIINIEDNKVSIEIITGRSGNFNLKWIKENGEEVILPITINSL